MNEIQNNKSLDTTCTEYTWDKFNPSLCPKCDDGICEIFGEEGFEVCEECLDDEYKRLFGFPDSDCWRDEDETEEGEDEDDI